MVEMNESTESNFEENQETQETDDYSTKVNEFELEEQGGPFKRAWKWLTTDKEKVGSIVFLLLFVAVIIVLALLDTNMGEMMTNIVDWFEAKIGLFGIYVGIFVISIFGNFTVIFPVPYTIALVAVATRTSIGPWEVVLMGVFAGTGAALGEASAWLIGKASKKVIEGSMEKQVTRAQKWIDKGLAPLIIFLFAATPLPDDAILVFIGLLGYALWKTLIWCFFGKIALTTATGFAAKYLVAETNFGRILLWAFGLQADGTVGEPPPVWLSAIVWIASLAIIAIFLFVNWTAIWNRMTRNALKNKYKQLLSPEIQNNQKGEMLLKSEFEVYDLQKSQKEIGISKEASFWQCVTERENEKYPEYHDLYTIPFVTGKSSNIIFDSNIISKIETNIQQEVYEKTGKHTIEKLILPDKYQEFLESEEIFDDLTRNVVFLSFNIKHPTLNRKYKVGMLFERIDEQQLKLRCIGEREAMVIRSFKSVPPEEILTGYLSLIADFTENPENVKNVTFAIYVEKPPEEKLEEKIEEIVEEVVDEKKDEEKWD